MRKSVSKTVRNVYTVYDKVAKQYRGLFYANTDEEMIRTSLPTVLMDFPLRDVIITRIGTFDDFTGDVVGSRHVTIPTDKYLFPHSRLSTPGDNLSLDELDQGIKTAKNEAIASKADKEAVNE